MNDFIDNVMPTLGPSEIKLALVIWRKTIGWGRLSEQIGTRELCKRGKLNKYTVKDTISGLCEKAGITKEQKRECGVLSRRRFTWPMNKRVTAVIAQARRDWVGGKVPPTPEGQTTPEDGGEIDPEGGGPSPPTQCNTYESTTYESTNERKVMKPRNVKPQPVNIGDPDLYVGRIQGLYDKLRNHDHREREGASPGDALPFSYSDFETLVNEALAVGACYHCGGNLTKSNCSPDHKRALWVGGKSELSNIRIICWECNKQKGHTLDAAFHSKMAATRLTNLRKRATKA
jgi:5-methylcytosine-specific restriction endonuclease McrA